MHRLGAPKTVPIEVDDEPLNAAVFDTVASALLAADRTRFRRSPVSGEPRAPYCMMGVCFECLISIDGVDGVQGCLVRVRPGMKIRRQLAPVFPRTEYGNGHR